MSLPVALSRRRAVLGLAAAAGVRGTSVAEPAGLNALAVQGRLVFGTGSTVPVTAAPARYAAAIATQCGTFTPSIPWPIQITLGKASLALNTEDDNVTFALDHGLRLSGGVLLRHDTEPADVRDAPPGAIVQALAAAHVDRTVGRYAGKASSWCVVSDAIDVSSGDADGMRLSALRRKLGPDFIAAAFRTARQADAAALLAYNDSAMEMDTPEHAARRAALLRLLDRLARAGAPVGAVGLTTRLRLDGTRFDPEVYHRFLAEIATRGLRILITAMDVADVTVRGDIAQRDEAVAAFYRDLLSVALAQRAVVGVSTCGLSDRYSSLTTPHGPGPRRADGLPLRPLPLDDRFEPKPAYAAIAQAFRARI